MDLKLPSDILLVVAKKSTNSGFIGKKFSPPTSTDNVYLPVSLIQKMLVICHLVSELKVHHTVWMP